MAQPQDHVEPVHLPPVLTSTRDSAPLHHLHRWAIDRFDYMGAKNSKRSISGRYASYGSSSNSYSHNAYPQSAYSQTPNQSCAPQYPSYGVQSKKTLDRKYHRIPDELAIDILRRLDPESSSLILGIDFTKSNEWTGVGSYYRRSLHHIEDEQNPYKKAISLIKLKVKYGYNFSLELHPPQDECAPPSPASTKELFPANPCSTTGKAIVALPTRSASFKRIFGFFEHGTDSGFGPRRLQDGIGGTSAVPSDEGVDLELGHPLDDIGDIRAHLPRAERHANYNQELLSYKQWKAYIEDRKIVNSGARDSMLIQPVITLLGEAFGGALAYTLSSSSEPSQINTLVRAGILIGVGLTVAGIGLRRFKSELSDNVMKAGAMGTALAIIVAFADLLPPWLAWSVGAATSILVAAGLAMI